MTNKTNNCPALNADTMNLREHRLWYQGQEVKGMSVKTKPYRIYNCDSTGHSSDHQHDKIIVKMMVKETVMEMAMM